MFIRVWVGLLDGWFFWMPAALTVFWAVQEVREFRG